MEITDKQRLDFLQSQSFTKWVGYDKGPTSKCVWPVYKHTDLRKEIDRAIKASKGEYDCDSDFSDRTCQTHYEQFN